MSKQYREWYDKQIENLQDLEIELDNAEDRGYGFLAMQIKEKIEKLKSHLCPQ